MVLVQLLTWIFLQYDISRLGHQVVPSSRLVYIGSDLAKCLISLFASAKLVEFRISTWQLFHSLAASTLKLLSAIFILAESLKILLFLGLSDWPALFFGAYGSNVIGLPSTFIDFQTSSNLIDAAIWLTDRSWNLPSMEPMLILSLILVLFMARSILFWVRCNSFVDFDLVSSLVILTLVHSCRLAWRWRFAWDFEGV